MRRLRRLELLKSQLAVLGKVIIEGVIHGLTPNPVLLYIPKVIKHGVNERAQLGHKL